MLQPDRAVTVPIELEESPLAPEAEADTAGDAPHAPDPNDIETPAAALTPAAAPSVRPRTKSAPKIWEMDLPGGALDAPEEPSAPAQPVVSTPVAQPPAPQPAPGVPSPIRRRVTSERVKTRLLGFHSEDLESDVFEAEPAKASAADPHFPIGWLVIVEGPGRGASFTLTAGLSTIGRDMNQTVTLDFGDNSISRERHASVAYDEDENTAYVGHGGKSNIVKLNGKPLLTTEELKHEDIIKIGKTVLHYVAFCSPDFNWSNAPDE